MFRMLFLAAGFFSTAAGVTCAAEYFVSTTGSDSAAGTLDQPWRTIQRAANAAVAGDTVQVRGGSYSERISLSGKAGTAALPIVIRNYQAESAIIDLTGVAPANGTAAIIRLHNCSHITLQGLEIRNYKTSSPDSVPIGILVSGGGTGVKLLNNRVHDIWQSYPVLYSFDANAHGILVSGNSSTAINELVVEGNEVYNLRLGASEAVVLNGNVTNFTVRRNTVHDCNNIGIDFIGYEGTNSNGALDVARNGVCAENTVHNIDTQYNPAYGGNFTTGGGNNTRGAAGIYVDGAANIIIERNHVHDCNFGIEVGCEHGGKNATGITVRNNLLRRNHVGGIFVGGYSRNVGGTTNSSITHNTLVVNDTAGYGGGQINLQHNIRTTTIRHNIMVANSATRQFILNSNTTTSLAANSIDWNLYVGASESSVEFIWRNSDYNSFTAWKSASGQDAHSRFASSAAFVDSGNGDFTLQSTSPARNAGDPAFTSSEGEVDFDGRARVFEDRTDMGFSEYGSPLANAPLVVTGAATVLDYSTATVVGTVNPVGMDALVWVEYGLTSAYGNKTTAQVIPAGTEAVGITATLSGLTHKKTWHYRVVASNITGKNAGADLAFATPAMPPPVFTGHPLTQMLPLGQPATLSSIVTGGEPMTLRWRRNSVSLPASRASGSTYLINSAALTDAGTYDVRAVNASDDALSRSAVVAVIDTSDSNITANEDSTLVLNVAAAPLNMLLCKWTKNGITLVDDRRITGAFTNRLTIRDFGPSDAGDYVCRISLGGIQGQSGVLNVSVRMKPVVAPLLPSQSWVVSGGVGDTLQASNSPDRFRVSGLPAGVSFDPQNGQLSGQPLLPGDYVIRISARNAAGYGPEQIIYLTVQPLPENVVGTFIGTTGRTITKNQLNLGSSVKLTVSRSGHITGTLQHGKYRVPIQTRLNGSLSAGFSALVPLKLPKPAATNLILHLAIDSATGNLTGELRNADNTDTAHLILNGVRNPWHSTQRPAAPYTGRYTLIGTPSATLDADPAYPKGWTIASLNVTKSGTATITGRLADDTSFTVTTILSATGVLPVHSITNASAASVLGSLDVTDAIPLATIDGALSWFKNPASTTPRRTYEAGIPDHDLTVTGSMWQTPSDGAAMMGLRTSDNNAVLELKHANIEVSAPPPTSQQIITLRSNYTAVIDKSVPNPLKVSVSVSPATGLFTGQFTLKDPNPISGKSAIIRQVKYRGAIVQHNGRAGGFFLLPGLPVPTADPPITSLNSPILSGLVTLEPIVSQQ